ncbi:alpha/beta hydrolase [Tropicimonas isoalkanivorans]|uniref:Esterase/lipase n=1 Tax=Tropicimonas isoalkanivorans TaxID=441112 RepID=A0A1I1FVZ9_9RHOB|nr:alpha/beta hydrolase [Tropicimonas isoalkanivorans]SFC03504.1 Esterase/lipase [Tropicimonas isoalkanivorans]
MKIVALLLVCVMISAAGVMVWGPREPVEAREVFDPATLPADAADLDGWLEAREATVPALRPENAKRIIWAGERGQVTPLSIVYLHGFSASSEEIRPIPDIVAERLGANLFYTRLSGHGRDGAAMAEPKAGDWIQDTAEALEIGRRIGERVLVLSASTGGTLAALAATDPALSEGLAGVVLISPNFRIGTAAASLLTLPLARHWVPVLAGEERGFTPQNEAHAAHWTHRYPTEAAVPLAALVEHVSRLDFSATRVPALFIYSRADQVVAADATDAVYIAWGGQAARELIEPDGTGDPSNHVIAGDIISPERTESLSDRITEWSEGL